jgi:hypothetical protein
MAIYYRVFGLVANLALFANLVLLVSLLSMLGATLTMPGIAGIILTVGISVDANILIFERIREELRTGNIVAKGDRGGSICFYKLIIYGIRISIFIIVVPRRLIKIPAIRFIVCPCGLCAYITFIFTLAGFLYIAQIVHAGGVVYHKHDVGCYDRFPQKRWLPPAFLARAAVCSRSTNHSPKKSKQ